MKKTLIVALNALVLVACVPTTTVVQRPPPPEPRYAAPEPRWERGTDWRPSIRERITDIRQRINAGVRNGDLTGPEADRLRNDLDTVLYNIDRMGSDGYLSERERDRIVARLNDLSDDVRRLRHNRAARY